MDLEKYRRERAEDHIAMRTCPFCGRSDLREKMASYVCNTCGKNHPKALLEKGRAE